MIRKHKSNLLRKRVRIREKLAKTNPSTPRLSVFRSNKHIYAQVIDLVRGGRVLAAASDYEIKKEGGKLEKARQVGELLTKKTFKKGIKNVVFDRAGYKFHGRVKALAQGAKKSGLKF